MTDRNDDARRLLQRTDVADAGVLDDGYIYVTDAIGKEGGPFVSFSEAVSWLTGEPDHITGMALCPCSCCVPNVWKKSREKS